MNSQKKSAVTARSTASNAKATSASNAVEAIDSLAVRYRVRWFNGIVGKSPTLNSAVRKLANGTLNRSLMMIGPLGTGKTTCGRIFAQSLTCNDPGPDGRPCRVCSSCTYFKSNGAAGHPDFVEINCSDKTGVDDMRQLIQMGNARPLIGRYRVFHLDEVQKLSESAKSVLLKFVEEPPKFTVIILSTMEPEKFYGDKPGAAMKSRVTEVLLPHPTNEEVAEHLAKIVKAEKVEVANSVLAIIADYADGIMRNAIKILDVVIDSGEEILKDKSLATAVIAKAAGKSPYEASKCALLALYNSNVGGLLEAIASFDNHNFMLKVMIEQNTDVIRYRVNPKYVKQGGPTFSARDLARSAITTNAVAKLGMRLQEIQHRAASYAINVDHALVNLVASSTSA